MTSRTFRLVRTSYPLTAICESCTKTFLSRTEESGQAEKEIRAAFDAHKCDPRSDPAKPPSES